MVLIHLERLGTVRVVLKEKVGNGRGRPKFLYRLADVSTPKIASAPGIVALEFPKFAKACGHEKGVIANPQATPAQSKTAYWRLSQMKSIKI
jgi:predicted ArsR family transcriptional regulator